MGELLQGIRERRSVRKYREDPVPDHVLETVLEAVRWSPSWANTQCWEIVVVRDPVVKQSLQESLPPKGNPAFKAIVAAPLVLAICGRKKASGYYKGEVTTRFGDWLLFDLGIATQNLCLAAHDQGLGTVIVGLFDHARAEKALGVPEAFELVALVPMGYPAKISQAPKRRHQKEFVHRDRFFAGQD
ncbi:MAG: nitroreductase family protein [Desulfobacteraceae bacterium]|jgi:nitroreductase|nr:nitroreductase family protein [Desulfobacteraceae bacterium]